jgi:hypothetical protein
MTTSRLHGSIFDQLRECRKTVTLRGDDVVDFTIRIQQNDVSPKERAMAIFRVNGDHPTFLKTEPFDREAIWEFVKPYSDGGRPHLLNTTFRDAELGLIRIFLYDVAGRTRLHVRLFSDSEHRAA